MSEEQLAALVARIKEDDELKQKLQGAADLDAIIAVAKDSGFDVSREAFIKASSSQVHELTDSELESVAGGTMCSASTGGCQGAFEIFTSILTILDGGC
jgi:predicted ribosomally synthesized peptide with nif11-like leader